MDIMISAMHKICIANVIPYWSNPNVNYGGVPTGVSDWILLILQTIV